VPRLEDLDLEGLEGVSPEMMGELLAVKPDEWEKELAGQGKFFESLQPNVPEELLEEHQKLAERLRL
jgi:GTP-dependent phosphoenolpyruvate carboxykinase